ncbi:ATP-binding protein [Pseudoalteromonas sp. BDTF-M6]|uniref:sensor histidine kinase n=1 Tax=Pseudoalteromonas sp. BDTF-M6 TaxID=2796132 RepID=UPI001BAFAF3C|nr:ATP-binding protein [Pseudoalteromonas sp. BDTF-M6]MBS3797782.1 HAMP domain-containing histidine kinase [Pseudoalteromonas sp. BDTF-M6]
MNLLLQSSISRVLLLRSLAIVVQFVAVLICHFLLELDLALPSLLSVIALESVFQLLSVWLLRRRIRRNERVGSLSIVWQLLADIFFLSLLLAFSGGATNAFVSLLLLPIMIAAVTLPVRHTMMITAVAIAVYSGLMLMLPEHQGTHHMAQMRSHFIAMWVNFVISALVVATLVSALARTLARQQKAMATNREEQMRAEQLLALGNAAAQATHQLATPLGSLALLQEELAELTAQDKGLAPVVSELGVPIKQCQQQLNLFRQRAGQLRAAQESQGGHYFCCLGDLLSEIQQAFALQFPAQRLVCNGFDGLKAQRLRSDPLLSAAFLNLLANAVRANELVQQTSIHMTIKVDNDESHWRIEDLGGGFNSEHLASLGSAVMASAHGLGVALWLSNATIERVGGRLALGNVAQGACIDVFIPMVRG